MSSSNPEATDSSNTRPPMSPAESSINSVFKMTKGCVMLKVKRHVSMHIYIPVCICKLCALRESLTYMQESST